MFSSIRDSLEAYPLAGVSTSLVGYLVSLSNLVSPALRFLILVFSTSTAISVAYVHFIKARKEWHGEKDTSKKDNSNPG